MMPIDLTKKAQIEEVLVAELDDAIVRTAKTRKELPVKYRRKARSVTGNTIHYYSRFHVKAKESQSSTSLKTLLEGLKEQIDPCAPQDLSKLSESVMNTLERGKDLMAVINQHRNKAKSQSWIDKRPVQVLKLRSLHTYNADFIVDE